MSEVCGRTGCGKKLRGTNTKGVCATGCLSPDAPGHSRAAGVNTDEGAGPKTQRRAASETLKRFRTVAVALGKDPDAILEEAAQEWLSVLQKAAE